MEQGILVILAYTAVPVVALIVSTAAAVVRTPGDTLISAFQHFAAGVVFAAVALELVPELHQTDAPLAMAAGFVAGLAAMLGIKTFSRKAGLVVPVAVDLFVDGMLVAIGFAAGVKGGMILLLGLTMETLSLGLAIAPGMIRRGLSQRRVLALAAGLGVALFAGAGFGFTLTGATGALLAAILGFGVSALLYLVTEELLVEAHETPDRPWMTAMFFLGFLIPLVLANLG